MSSLIDRQAAIEVASKKCYELRGVFGDIEEGLNELPTVEAIPVEQIKSKIDAILNSYPDGNEETEILCKLLYEWEKENERI